MALSKEDGPEKVNIIDPENLEISISPKKMMEVCKMSYKKAISIEVVHHLLGGEHMDYSSVMEIPDSFQCYAFCCGDLLAKLKGSKEKFFTSKTIRVPPLTH